MARILSVRKQNLILFAPWVIAAGCYLALGWILQFLIAALNILILWYIDRRWKHAPDYSLEIVGLIFAFSILQFSSAMSDRTRQQPIWVVSARHQRNADCDNLLSPIAGKPIRQYSFSLTSEEADNIRMPADYLIAQTVTRNGTIPDPNYIFFNLSYISATFPDGQERRAWYRAVMTDARNPDLTILYMEAGTNTPLMMIKDVALTPGVKLADMHCNHFFGVLPPQWSVSNSMNTNLTALLLALVWNLGVALIRYLGLSSEGQ
jgi:hypothetical protein